jgi:sulfite reductase alpha subunit-like flavoprotein
LITLTLTVISRWSPGDIAILHPSNQPEDVQAILERFDWLSIADSPLNIISKSIDQPLPSHLADTTATLRELFTSVLDISCVPRKSFFEWLVHFTSDTLEKEKFEEFTSLTTDGMFCILPADWQPFNVQCILVLNDQYG